MPSDSVRHPTLFTNYLFSLNVKFDYLFLIDKIDWVPFLLSKHMKICRSHFKCKITKLHNAEHKRHVNPCLST